jgi:RNA-directed DNA polymerase
MNTQDFNDWQKLLLSYSRENNNVYLLDYLESFKEKEIPIIFNSEHLSLLVGIDHETINSIIHSTPKYYRQFTIKKRTGGERQISTPYPVLKHIQRWILSNILEKNVINSSATGFVKKKSIKDNVNPHLGERCVLKIDLKDFFPSINQRRIISVFNYCGYLNQVSFFLSELCCLDKCLPQGACTSPYLANIISKRMDTRLFSLARKFGYSYTRYADDITFSGDDIPWKFNEYIKDIVNNEGFQINKDKTKLMKGNSKKIITGISITSGKTQLPRRKKRELRYLAYKLLSLPIEKYKNEIFLNDPIYMERLVGKFRFWNFIENENEYVIATLKNLKDYNEKLNI